MSRPSPRRRGRASTSLAALAIAGLVVASCGDDDASETSSTTAAPVAGETTVAPVTTSPGSDAGLATADEIAELCPADEAPDKLVFAVWTTQKDLVGAAFAGFTEATGVEVEFLENSTGDRLTKLNAEKGAPTIDVSLIPVNEVPTLLANGVVMATDTTIPNYEQLIDVAKIDGGYGTSILQFGIAYNPKYVTTPPTSIMDLFDDAYAGHLALPAMPNSGGYALLTQLTQLEGGDESDLSPGIEVVAANKDNVATFFPFAPGMEAQIKAEEIWIYPDIGGSVMASKSRGVPVEVVIPEEGGPAGMNVAVIPEGVSSEGCAKALVSWMLGQEVQQAFADKLYYGPSGSAIELPDEIASRVFPQDPDTLVQIDWATIAQHNADTLDLWNRTVIG
jgi:putative spermidine/putrescine transport system substrate-binding protein